MAAYWKNIVEKVDALSLRERVIIFIMLALALITGLEQVLLDPYFAKQQRLLGQINAEHSRIAQLQGEIRQIMSTDNDQDRIARQRLHQLERESKQMHASLLALQKGLASPDAITSLLGDIVRREGSLRLLSLKTLPVAGLNEAAGADGKIPAAGVQPVGPVYKHGVELVVQGSYADMARYMDKLEKMPWQLLWGKARLTANEYPQTTLHLTLFTLSLDKEWLNF